MDILETLIPFIILHLCIFLIPGPNISLVIRNTLNYGLKAGLFSAFGIMSAISIHAIFAVLATDMVIAKFLPYFVYMHMISGIYLISLGIYLLKHKVKQPVFASITLSPPSNHAEEMTLSYGQAYQMSFLLDIFNPAIFLFYLSVFPAFLKNFVSPLTLCGLVALMNLWWFGSVAYVVAWTKEYYSLHVPKWVEPLIGMIMIAFGLYQMVAK